MKFRDNPERVIKLTEKFDLEHMRRLLLSDLIDAEGKRALQKYLKKLQDGQVNVVYSSKELGRLEAKIDGLKPNETCMTQMNMWNVMKAVGCRAIYSDVDIKNCHPTLLVQLFESEGYETPHLKTYVKDRNLLVKQLGVDKKAVKCLMFGLIYNSGHFNEKKWQEEHGIETIPQLFYDLQQEVQDNTSKVLEKYNEYRMLAKKRKQADYWNLEGSALSYLAQQMEKTCLLAMYDHLKHLGYTVGALIHDGMHVEGKLSASLLQECADAVHHQTGFRIELEVKPFDNHEALLQGIQMVSDDYEAAMTILEAMKTSDIDLVNCRGALYFRQNDVYIVDATKDASKISSSVMNYINRFTLFKGEDRPVSVTRNYTSAKSVLKMVLNHAPMDDQFHERIFDWEKGKLCYTNGYYDFNTGQFSPYDRNSLTTMRIPFDYNDDVSQEDMDEVQRCLFDPIFTEDAAQQKFFLERQARVMAGHVEDKYWMVMLGNRNCGKSVLVTLNTQSFPGYAVTTEANHFLAKKGSGDSARDLHWAVHLRSARAVYTNEIDMAEDGVKTKLNGAMIKSIVASGGDEITCRALYENQMTFKPMFQFCLMLNDMPESNVADAMETCIELHMNSQFVKGTPTNNGIVKEYKADPTIKDYIKTEKCIRAYTQILLRHYKPTEPNIPHSVKQNMQGNAAESDLSKFTNLFEFTSNKHDFLPRDQFEAIIGQELSEGCSRKKVMTWAKRKNPKVVCSDGRFYKKVNDYGKRVEGLRYMKKVDVQSNS
jgi:hypothetical protein